MDNIRFVLVMAMLMISYMLWESWQIDYGPKPQAIVSDTPSVAGSNETASSANPSPTEASQPADQPSSHVITVKTDVFALEIDPEGGTLRNLDLLQYPHEKENTYVNKAYELIGMQAPQRDLSPIRLFDSSPDKLFLAQSGLVASGDSASAPDHHAKYNSEKTSYQLQEGQEELNVPLTWTNEQGLRITKTFTFKRGSYTVDVAHKVSNQSGKPWTGRQYNQLLRVEHSDKSGNNFIRTYSGGVVYTQKDKYQKVKYDDMVDGNLDVASQGGWSAFIQHYFASAWIPPAEQENHFYTKALNEGRFVIGSYSQDVSVQPAGEGVFSAQMFVGPKIQPMMEAVAPGLELTVDYSWLTIIAKPIYWMLNQIYDYIGNWGVAIL
ncbi:MAG: membrane protein insertase YidC, partial [Methylomonas sp.]|nr:membrane protein insertase YidC [Methylomonas sp.]